MPIRFLHPLSAAIGATLLAGTATAGATDAFRLVDLAVGHAVATDEGHGADGACGGQISPLDMMDTDKDGVVSKAEHMAYASALFDATDTNKDGQISREELEQAQAEGKSAGQANPEGSCGGHR